MPFTMVCCDALCSKLIYLALLERLDGMKKRFFDPSEGSDGMKKRFEKLSEGPYGMKKRFFNSSEGSVGMKKRFFDSSEGSDGMKKRYFDSSEGSDGMKKRFFDSSEGSDDMKKRTFYLVSRFCDASTAPLQDRTLISLCANSIGMFIHFPGLVVICLFVLNNSFENW